MELFYDGLFPHQVRRAEMVVNSTRLTTLIQERLRHISAFESVYAKQVHQEKEYKRLIESSEKGASNSFRCSKRKLIKPVPIMIRVGGTKCCSRRGELVEALPYYMSEIRRTNKEVDEEYEKIIRRKEIVDRGPSLLGPEKESLPRGVSGKTPLRLANMEKYLAKIFLPHENVSGREGPEIGDACGNGFVEFKTRAAKQAALQCNLTGRAAYFTTEQAPDPRDLIWENAPVSRSSIRRNYLVVQGILLIGMVSNIFTI